MRPTARRAAGGIQRPAAEASQSIPRSEEARMIRCRPLLVKLALAGVLLLWSTAWAQERYPARPVTLIVPGSAGDGLDLAARALAESLQANLGQTIAVV